MFSTVEIECQKNMTVWFTPIEPFEGLVHFGNDVNDPVCLLERNSEGVYE